MISVSEVYYSVNEHHGKWFKNLPKLIYTQVGIAGQESV